MEKQKATVVNQITARWVGGYAFDQITDGFTVRTESQGLSEAPKGPGPKKLVLVSLAGCSGIDVVSILDKMRIVYESFTIDVEADLSDEHPKVYTAIRLTYTLSGKELDRKKITRAVELSLNNYCGVAAMLRKNCPIDYELVLEEG